MEGVSFADAQDSLHNADKAKAELEKAKAELQSQGVQFPIHIDYVVDQSSNALVQQADSMKSSIEAALGKDNVVIDVQNCLQTMQITLLTLPNHQSKKTLIWISLVGDLTSKTHLLTWIS